MIVYEIKLGDGRRLMVMPLTFARARLYLADARDPYLILDEW